MQYVMLRDFILLFSSAASRWTPFGEHELYENNQICDHSCKHLYGNLASYFVIQCHAMYLHYSVDADWDWRNPWRSPQIAGAVFEVKIHLPNHCIVCCPGVLPTSKLDNRFAGPEKIDTICLKDTRLSTVSSLDYSFVDSANKQLPFAGLHWK